MTRIVIYILYLSLVVAQPGILNVGFDVDDTILFSRDVFLSLPDDKRCLLYTSPSPRDKRQSRMPSSA